MRPLRTGVPFVLSLVVVSSTALYPDELGDHVKDYLEARPKVRGLAEDRARKAQELVAPILRSIGKLGSEESLAFLKQEMDTAIPEIGACCPGPILSSSNPASLDVVLRGFSRRDRLVRIAILEALARTPRDLAAGEEEILAIAQGADFDTKLKVPPVLAKLDTVPAAKALVASCQTTKSPKGEDRTGALSEAIFEALKSTKSDAVKGWLARGAFDAAGSDALKLPLVVRVAGELKLQDAREDLQKLVSHSSKKVASAALDSLGKIGIGKSAAEIAAALEKRKGKEDLAFRTQSMDALAALGTPEALEIVLKYAKGSDADMRAIAIGSLSRFEGETRAMEALLGALSDADEGIRRNALWGLSAFRDKAMIGPLIRVLEKDEEQLRIRALELLVKLTGQNMDLVADDWKKWWEVAAPKFQLPDAKAKGTTRVKAREFSYFGLEVSSKKVAFLVDASGSMNEMVPVKLVKERGGKGDKGPPSEGGTSVGGNGGGGDGGRVPIKDGKAMKIDLLKRELSGLLRKLPGDTQVNIVTFCRDFTPWQSQLQPLSTSGRAKAIDFVKGISTQSGTNVFDTLEFALGDKRVDTIYLLSDGLPTAGRHVELSAITREIQGMNRRRGITIHCIAFGEESKLLEALAKENGGQYRFVDKIEE